MCEYCGCQTLSAIAELTREHDRVVELIAQVRAAVGRADLTAAARACRRMAAVLGPHTRVEEEGLFPALAGEFPEHVERLRADHRDIGAVLAEAADATPTDPGWSARLLAAMHELREHILREQDGVFPAALTSLGPDDWDRVDAVRAEVTAWAG